MQTFRKAKRFMPTLLMLALNLAVSACSGLTSPVDQAYYTGGDMFSYKGGYTRTIFSSSNF